MAQSSGRDGSCLYSSHSHSSVSLPCPETSQASAGAGSSRASESVSLPQLEASTVQALMDYALPRFAGLGDGPRQVHEPWKVSADPPALPAASRLDTSDGEDRVRLSSPCLNLDELSSSDDDTGGSVGLSDLSVTLLCGSDEVFTPVNSDQGMCRTIRDR